MALAAGCKSLERLVPSFYACVVVNPPTLKPSKSLVYLALWRMRFPSTAIASILHRISGVLLFLTLPILALLVADVLQGRSLETWSMPGWQALWLVMIWAWTHHAIAGVRLLLADFHWGMDARIARISAWAVIVMAALIAVLLWVRLL
jgi:succinate dehydrogenase / fumarate reductase cytochrome b subunit